MKKFLPFILAVLMLLELSACGSTAEPGSEPEQTSGTAVPTEPERVTTVQEPTATNNPENASGGSNILIAYFTWADNIVVENSDTVDIDATTSASVLVPGNPAQFAEWIQTEVGGDLFSIKVTEPYATGEEATADESR